MRAIFQVSLNQPVLIGFLLPLVLPFSYFSWPFPAVTVTVNQGKGKLPVKTCFTTSHPKDLSFGNMAGYEAILVN